MVQKGHLIDALVSISATSLRSPKGEGAVVLDQNLLTPSERKYKSRNSVVPSSCRRVDSGTAIYPSRRRR